MRCVVQNIVNVVIRIIIIPNSSLDTILNFATTTRCLCSMNMRKFYKNNSRASTPDFI